ncbi:MAG: hypothetical protein COS39_03635 [Hydrogenophilales bacterium CG03_land_8_20_14_0_80_62_28]|nr:hypothetical protein [Betaproteobacteria bacterium]PIV23642.1 MAG: hypothetical protein COS39_03635 [Hydrogenophilales bacterium CG03_land_8_20_14_0_80_62_28]PIW38294.1 MAG: hypothetical protein COW23_07375 [Hydrogenophilales bacterium CG15_BIG_FIL_POST_REV_8_21_14_020_62_31]PIW71643.1 MAG: hypothetical protein COW07_07200 [Hydrogenophilales bacterium CG12_big_fil_rev_8_21_14_0_65_61_21]PIX02576.1 MAG: hypothetical protein COZ79_01035 [Hydrogenophilales bacterium CG_4_8_14_3_um_filter_62_83]
MSSDEKCLLRLFRALSEANRKSLTDYAEFLGTREVVASVVDVSQTPLAIPRPEQESVIKAVKRLMLTYPMLGRDTLLQDTSTLVTRHVIHKLPALEVIDELELLFKRHYDAHLQAAANQEPS